MIVQPRFLLVLVPCRRSIRTFFSQQRRDETPLLTSDLFSFQCLPEPILFLAFIFLFSNDKYISLSLFRDEKKRLLCLWLFILKVGRERTTRKRERSAIIEEKEKENDDIKPLSNIVERERVRKQRRNNCTGQEEEEEDIELTSKMKTKIPA